jgi:hypothetical protein
MMAKPAYIVYWFDKYRLKKTEWTDGCWDKKSPIIRGFLV